MSTVKQPHYVAHGMVYNFVTYNPENSIYWYSAKVSKKGKDVGNPTRYNSENLAKQDADRRAAGGHKFV